jgi:hypothetical protein
VVPRNVQRLRLVYKPHSVRRIEQVYTCDRSPKLLPCRSLQRSSIYAVYPRLASPEGMEGAGRSIVSV